MSDRVLRELHNRNSQKTVDNSSKISGKGNNETEEVKKIHFGAVRFYSSQNNISLSALRKRRVRNIPVPSKEASAYSRKSKKLKKSTVENSKGKKLRYNRKNTKTTAVEQQLKTTVKKQQHSKTKTDDSNSVKKYCPYKFMSSSVEVSNNTIDSLPKSSLQQSPEKQQDSCDNVGKKFFTSRHSKLQTEGKVTMSMNRGRFHLGFSRESTKTVLNNKTGNNLKKTQKRKKIPLTVDIKSVETTRKKIHVKSSNKQEIMSEMDSSEAMKQSNEKLCINSDLKKDNVIDNNQNHCTEGKEPFFSTVKTNKTSTPIKPVQAKIDLCTTVESSPIVSADELFNDEEISEQNEESLFNDESSKQKEGPSSFQKVEEWKNILSETAATDRSIEGISKKPKTSPKRFLKFYSKDNDKSQLLIDAGQKSLGAKQCTVCNMLYTSGELDDERAHRKYHTSYLTILKFPQWKKEHHLADFPDGRVIMVLPSDANYMLKKVRSIEQIIDRDLGISNIAQTKVNMTYVLFITTDQKVAGCAIVEKISQAYRVIPNITKDLPVIGTPRKILFSESEPVKALCGICRLWIAPPYRRQKIATRILDCLRCHFIFGYVLNVDEIAFLDPTIEGRKFVEAYTQTSNYLIYFKISSQ